MEIANWLNANWSAKLIGSPTLPAATPPKEVRYQTNETASSGNPPTTVVSSESSARALISASRSRSSTGSTSSVLAMVSTVNWSRKQWGVPGHRNSSDLRCAPTEGRRQGTHVATEIDEQRQNCRRLHSRLSLVRERQPQPAPRRCLLANAGSTYTACALGAMRAAGCAVVLLTSPCRRPKYSCRNFQRTASPH